MPQGVDDGSEDRRLFTGSVIEVYTSTLSARAGDEVGIHVSTTASRFDLRIERFGAEPTVVWSAEGLRGEFHPSPDDAWEGGCDWPAIVQVRVEDDWRSGYFEVIASAVDETGAVQEYEAFFVVRATRPTAPSLLVLSTNTYAAYNFYGGGSLYQSTTGPGGERRVSMLRPWIPGWLRKPESYDILTESLAASVNQSDPLHRTVASGVPWLSCATGFANWERVFVAWMERNGYELDYAVQSDLDADPELLDGYKLFLSVGHDEYWSWRMRDAVEGFIARGGNACFFSGNTACWQVRLDDDGATVVCYRYAYREDPLFDETRPELATTKWISNVVGRPESRMTGVTFAYAGFSRFHSVAPNGPGGYLIYRPEHWIFAGTGVGYGDLVGENGVVLRYEVDGCPIRMELGLPYPAEFHDADPSFEVIGMAPAALEPGDYPGLTFTEVAIKWGLTDPRAIEYIGANHGHAVMGMYTAPGTVFTAGTTDWANGLAGDDPVIERITRNLIDRLSA